MKATGMRRFDFDPAGRTQVYLADWDREIEAMSLRRLATEANKAADQHESGRVGMRFAKLSHRVRQLQLRPAH